MALSTLHNICPQYVSNSAFMAVTASMIVSSVASFTVATKLNNGWYMSTRFSLMLVLMGVSEYFMSSMNTSRYMSSSPIILLTLVLTAS